MNKINKLLTLALSCLMLLGFSACDEDNLSTNQYQKGVGLNVFGPSPVVRGGTLRFLGSNLDQIKQVIIPGIDPITTIEVRQAGVPSEILVQVPKDGPEEGYVTLVTATGEKITTTTKLTYEETIEFTRFSPASAMPGEVITIEGDYLNLIHEVIFAEDVAVPETEFITHNRYKIEVTVPEKARTGQLIISDGEENLPNWIYSEGELVIGTPVVESFHAARFKADETLTIAGTHLNLVDYVKFNGVEISSAALAKEGAPSFSINAEGTEITLTQPAEAASGAVSLILRSGVELLVVTDEEFQVVVPTELAVAPKPVKAGEALTVTGKDMDLITSVVFPTDVEGGEFMAEATKLVIAAVPETAVDGEVTLMMANGMSVTVSYELVKPTVASYSVNPVNAGALLTLQGSNLDLVSSVSIGGGEGAIPEEGSTDTALVISVPMDSKNGAVVLTLANGTTVEAAELTVNEALFCYITELPNTEETEIKAGTSLTVPVANSDKLISVEVNGVSAQHIVEAATLHIGLPQSAGKNTSIRLVSSNGEITYTIDVASDTKVVTVIWTGEGNVGAWGAMTDLSWDGYDWSTVKAGTELTIHFIEDESFDYWKMRFGNGSWSALPGSGGDISLEAGATSYTLILTQEIVDELANKGGLVMTGCNYTINKITLSE